MSNRAVVLPAAKARLIVQNRKVPIPGPNDILIRSHAVAINPVDWKIQQFGFFVKSYPVILGSDTSGIVQAVGSSVKRFKQGDRVTGFAGSIVLGDGDHGAFQEYPLLKTWAAAKIPEQMTFEEGAMLPMAVATAGVGIFLQLEIPRPGGKKQTGGFMVYGGSSSTGGAAIQIAKSLGFTVFAVAGKQNHESVKALGATAVVDPKDGDVEEQTVAAAKGKGIEIKYGFDAISSGQTPAKCVEILKAFGGGKLCLTVPPPGDMEKSDQVSIVVTAAFKVVTEPEFGRFLLNEWLEESLANKSYVPSPAIQIVDGGLESVQKACDLLMAGVSGKKLVVPLQ